jgi:hypothetical protein
LRNKWPMPIEAGRRSNAGASKAKAKPTRRGHDTRGARAAAWRRGAVAWRVRRGRWAPARLWLGPPRARAERWDGPGIEPIVAGLALRRAPWRRGLRRRRGVHPELATPYGPYLIRCARARSRCQWCVYATATSWTHRRVDLWPRSRAP